MATFTPPAAKLEKSHEGEHHGDYGDTSITITRQTKMFAFCAAINSCNLGYDIGVNTNTYPLIQAQFGLSETQIELFLGSINFWSIFGAFGAQYFSDTFGRRRTFVVAAIFFVIGLTILALAPSYVVLMIGRVFVGTGVGVGLAIDPLYIAEVSPAKFRGELVTWSEIATNIGLVLGFSTGLTLGYIPEGIRWRIMFILGAIMPIIIVLLVRFIMPESPRWLVSKNNDAEAKIVLQQIYPEGFDVDAVINDIKESLDRERIAEKTVGWGAICRPTPAFRRMILVGVFTAVAQQAVGIDAIQYYLLHVLEQARIESVVTQNIVLILLGLVKLAFIVVGGKLFDSRGRRPLFFISLIGMAVALFIISMIFFVQPDTTSGFVVFSLALYLAFFSVGMGPGAWLIPSEVFATCIRAKAMSLATVSNRIMATIMSSTFLSLVGILSWAGFFLYLTFVCFIITAILYIVLPETKGRSLEDMSYYFAEITGDDSILEAERRMRSEGPTMEITSSTAGGNQGGVVTSGEGEFT